MKIGFLSGNALKILAAIFMTLDHVGLMFFPYETAFRIVGRLAMPIFAFMISEGARYTKNRLKYLGLIAALAFVCQAVYFFAMGSLNMSILVTFTLSIIMIYALDGVKREMARDKISPLGLTVSALLFLGSVAFSYVFCTLFDVDYGFFGALLPLFASLTDMRRCKGLLPNALDSRYIRILLLGIGLLLLSISIGGIQFYSLLALPILCLYSGERGRLKMKYFFYLFYPLHLVVLEGIYVIIKGI